MDGVPAARIGNITHPVDDVAAGVQFYRATLGLPTKFVDGDRYAALDGQGPTLALAGASEDLTEGRPAASFKVVSVTDTLAAIESAGGEVVRPAQCGAHEIRAVARDPWGNMFVLYQ
ncbi:VOC family protein [Rhodococcus rhodochrous]|uniref:VOC family protein n=1 Tax=Rhodococcus rhodochrous TaxID=1829 RepID=A0AAW4XNY4_RHORH|nr:VOC family protein [Rhodococcus rhodochrous]MCD2114122.1 VOC family protein [Rhodococcus rhodochrous]